MPRRKEREWRYEPRAFMPSGNRSGSGTCRLVDGSREPDSQQSSTMTYL